MHGDSFGPYCMYSNTSYRNGLRGHPPQTGWSMDGPALYGRYLSESAPGYNVSLDDCGGHTHDSYDYHYHAQITTEITNSGIPSNFGVPAGLAYASFSAGVYKCYRADLSSQAGYFNHNDLTLVQPCCESPQAYLAPGITLTTTAGSPAGPPSSCNAQSGMKSWLILVIVASCVLPVLLVAIAILCCCRSRKRRKAEAQGAKVEELAALSDPTDSHSEEA